MVGEPMWVTERTDRNVRDALDRDHPERLQLRPRDLAGIRTAMDVVAELWSPTFERARRLSAEALHTRVAGEYSFIETLRHLLFAGDAWLHQMVLHDAHPFHKWGVPPDAVLDGPADTGPELAEVLSERDQRASRVRSHLAALSDDDLRVRVGGPWDPPDLPEERRARVIDCFRVVFNEEWWHHRYATRDLALLEREQRHL